MRPFPDKRVTHASDVSRWLVGDRDPRSGVPHLFCFPHGGGSASAFHAFRRLLSPGVDVLGVELPGRGSRFREPLDVTWEAIAATTANAILNRARGPIFIYGHSIGALLAYETARELAARRSPPKGLIVSGRRPPHKPPRADVSSLRAAHTLADAELKDLLARYAGTPAAILDDDEMMRLYLPVIRHDFELDDKYRFVPGALLDTPVWAYGGRQDSLVSPFEMDAWGELTNHGCEVIDFDGGHFFPYERAVGFCRDLASRILGSGTN